MVIIARAIKAITILVDESIVSVTGIIPTRCSSKCPGVATNNAADDE